MPELNKLREEIAEDTTVKASAAALIRGQAQRLRDLATVATDFASLKAAVLAEAATLDKNNADLSAAVAENTVAENEPTP